MTTSLRDRFHCVSRTFALVVLLLCLTLAACGGGGGGAGGSADTGSGDDGGDGGGGDPDDTLPALLHLEAYLGDFGGPGYLNTYISSARFNAPRGLAFDSEGNLYVADNGNAVVRKVTAGGEVSTFAMMEYQPLAIAVDPSDRVYVTDSAQIERLAADGTGEWTASGFGYTKGMAFGSDGTLYVADSVHAVIYAVDSAGDKTVFAGGLDTTGSADGTGTAARFDGPAGLAMGDGVLYVAESMNATVRAVTVPGAVVTTLAGEAGELGYDDGTGAAARFWTPQGIAIDGDGNLYVADGLNQIVRKVTSAGVVTTLAGLPETEGLADGVGTDARFTGPEFIAHDPATGALMVSDSTNHMLRFVYPSNGNVARAGGAPALTGTADGDFGLARFTSPGMITTDSAGNLYLLDAGVIRKADTTEYEVSTVPFEVTVDGLALDSDGDIYVTVANLHVVGVVFPDDGGEVLAGSVNNSGAVDGDALTEARFNTPKSIVRDSAGNLYMADTGNCAIRKITPAGVVSTLAGDLSNPCLYDPDDGTGTGAAFADLKAIAIDAAGNLYVIDQQAIRKITPGGVVTTLAGNLFDQTGSDDGTGTDAFFNDPRGLTVDGAGIVYVADYGNNTIRKITPAGVVTTLVGDPGSVGFLGGSLPGAVAHPAGVTYRSQMLFITTDHGVALVKEGGGG